MTPEEQDMFRRICALEGEIKREEGEASGYQACLDEANERLRKLRKEKKELSDMLLVPIEEPAGEARGQ